MEAFYLCGGVSRTLATFRLSLGSPSDVKKLLMDLHLVVLSGSYGILGGIELGLAMSQRRNWDGGVSKAKRWSKKSSIF